MVLSNDSSQSKTMSSHGTCIGHIHLFRARVTSVASLNLDGFALTVL